MLIQILGTIMEHYRCKVYAPKRVLLSNYLNDTSIYIRLTYIKESTNRIAVVCTLKNIDYP